MLVFPVHKMLSFRHFIPMAIVMLSSLFRISVPIHILSKSEATAFIPGSLDKAELSLPSRFYPRRSGKVPASPKAYIRSPVVTPPGNIAFKFLLRGPAYEIVPIRVGALALHAFYTSISHSAATIWPQTRRPTNSFTITQGALQLTMSGFVNVVPWDFVEDWAMKAAESVARGWTDTFDAAYEIEGTGVGVWVSLRLLKDLMGDVDMTTVPS